MYQYPRRIRRIINGACTILLLLNLGEYGIAWARAIYANLFTPLSLPYIPFLGPFQDWLGMLLSAHLGLGLSLILLRALSFAVPDITLVDQGLEFKARLGSRLVRFDAMRDVRSVELPNGRFIVWVHSAQGLPLQGLVASLLFGKRLWRGFMLTSDQSGFDTIIAQIVGCMKGKYGEEGFEANWHEIPPTWQMRMLSNPAQTVRDALDLEDPPYTLQQAGLQMTVSSLPLTLPLIAGGMIHPPQFLWSVALAIIVLIVAVVEWPLVAAYLSMIPIGETHQMAMESALAVYPLTQLTRWVPALGLTVLVATGVPTALLILAAIPAVAWAALPVKVLTEAWFEAKPPESYLGVIGTVIYQLILYETLLLMVPR